MWKEAFAALLLYCVVACLRKTTNSLRQERRSRGRLFEPRTSMRHKFWLLHRNIPWEVFWNSFSGQVQSNYVSCSVLGSNEVQFPRITQDFWRTICRLRSRVRSLATTIFASLHGNVLPTSLCKQWAFNYSYSSHRQFKWQILYVCNRTSAILSLSWLSVTYTLLTDECALSLDIYCGYIFVFSRCAIFRLMTDIAYWLRGKFVASSNLEMQHMLTEHKIL